MTEFYQRIAQENYQEIANKMNVVQTTFKALQNEAENCANYIQEVSLEIPTNGTYEEQVKTFETIIERTEDIIQQKDEMNKKREIILKNMKEIFESELLKDNKDIIEDYHEKVVLKLLELKEKNHENELKKKNEENKRRIEKLENEEKRKIKELENEYIVP